MSYSKITHLYNTGETNGKDGKIIVLRENGARERVWLHHGDGMDLLRSHVKNAVDLAILHPNQTINCETGEVSELSIIH